MYSIAQPCNFYIVCYKKSENDEQKAVAVTFFFKQANNLVNYYKE